MFLLLLISFLGTCGTVYYILYKYKHERKTSISLHVALDKYSHRLYALGHFVGGLAFLLFTYNFFYIKHGSLLLLVLACIGFLVEQVQAFFPHNARFGKVHKAGAVLMGTFMILLLVFAPSVVHLTSSWLAVYLCLSILYALTGLYAFRNNLKFYRAQLLFFSVFYLFLLVLFYGGSS